MKKVLVTAMVFALTFVLGYAVPVPAQEEQIKLSGPHFTLNIIAVEKNKGPIMTDSNRHTIFVGLDKAGKQVTTRIYLRPGYDFAVCDGNGFDTAYDCSGEAILRDIGGATFQLPCNTNPELVYSEDLGCPDDVAQRSYAVYARALGKPGFKADMMTCAYDKNGELFCATDNVLTLKRSTGQSIWQNATSELTTLVADVNGDGKAETVALFANGFEDFFWQYDNYGLRHAQIRFYPLAE